MDPKPASRTDRKKEETLKKIISVAVELFNRHGFEAVTMEKIAETADIAKGTLYNYFPFKEAIINAYLQRSFQERNDDRIAKLNELPDTRARLTLIFSLLVEGVQRQKQVFEIFMVSRMKRVLSFQPVAPDEQSGLSVLLRAIIRLGIESQELRGDLPESIMEDLAEFAIIEAIKPFYLQPDSYDMQQSINWCVDVFMNGTKA